MTLSLSLCRPSPRRTTRPFRYVAITVVLPFLACACAPEDLLQGVSMRESDPPLFLSAEAVSERAVDLLFSKPVTIRSYGFSPVLDVGEISDGSERISFLLSEDCEPGARYALDVEAEDDEGNSISVYASVLGFNGRVPALVLNEARFDYSKPKVEFLELKTLDAGNLGGVAVYVASSGSEPVYCFPPVESAAGEFVVLHFRSVEDGLVDELDALDASAGTDSYPLARDFWIDGSSKKLRKTDAILIRKRPGGSVVDALLVAEDCSVPWSDQEIAAAAASAVAEGAWLPEDAIGATGAQEVPACSGGTTATRTLCRTLQVEEGETKPAPGRRSQWRIVPTGGATPGRENAEGTYVPPVD